jgi:hypothetical protein
VTQAWQDGWFATGIKTLSALLWRGVEAQHHVATMRLVDSLDEQAELERILEASKPALPPAARALHHLLATPFRYRSRHPSRFRKPGDPGLWYGAEELHTACAEVGYWRWRFLMDSAGLRDGELVTEHTFFQAEVRGRAVDLTRAPWKASAAAWTHDSDYAACQGVALAAREHRVQWIRYASARKAEGVCGAVLDPAALSLPRGAGPQTWVSKVTATQALMLHDEDRLTVAIAAR